MQVDASIRATKAWSEDGWQREATEGDEAEDGMISEHVQDHLQFLAVFASSVARWRCSLLEDFACHR